MTIDINGLDVLRDLVNRLGGLLTQLDEARRKTEELIERDAHREALRLQEEHDNAMLALTDAFNSMAAERKEARALAEEYAGKVGELRTALADSQLALQLAKREALKANRITWEHWRVAEGHKEAAAKTRKEVLDQAQAEVWDCRVMWEAGPETQASHDAIVHNDAVALCRAAVRKLMA